MDTKIDGNPSKSEVIGRCAGGGKMNDHAKPTKVERQKIIIKMLDIIKT